MAFSADAHFEALRYLLQLSLEENFVSLWKYALFYGFAIEVISYIKLTLSHSLSTYLSLSHGENKYDLLSG